MATGLAHMEGARRIFDSITPGYEEIGSVWLPLYHLICAPLAINDFLWRTGLAGGLVSSAAFALTCLFPLPPGGGNQSQPGGGACGSGRSIAVPKLPLPCEHAADGAAGAPVVGAGCLRAFSLFAIGLVEIAGRRRRCRVFGNAHALRGVERFAFCHPAGIPDPPVPVEAALHSRLVFCRRSPAAGPFCGLFTTPIAISNPLEFYNGMGSAKDIYAHQLATTAFPYPTDGSLLLSARYYLEDLKLVIGVWALELAVLGLVAWCASLRESRRGAVAVLFIVPLPFYIQAMAHAAVPLYVPTLFPHAHYNLRYGMEMIAAVALFPSFVFSPRLGRNLRIILLIIFLALLGRQFAQMTAGGPRELPVVKEGIRNTPCRAQRQRAIIEFLRAHYDGKRVLVAAGKWPCVMPEVGIYFRNTLSNRNRKYWAKMRTEPQKWVEWIIRGDGDAVDSLMQAYPQAFTDFEVVDQGTFQGEGSFKIYRLRNVTAANRPFIQACNCRTSGIPI